jgi:hypothetical protein
MDPNWNFTYFLKGQYYIHDLRKHKRWLLIEHRSTMFQRKKRLLLDVKVHSNNSG